MATNKELNSRIEQLEQKLQELGDLQPQLQEMRELLATEADARARAETLLASATDAQTRLTATTTQVEEASTRATALSADLTRFKEDLDKIDTSSRDIITQQQTAFSTSETERSTAFSTLLAAKSKELDKTLTDLGETTEKSIGAINESVKADKAAVEEAKSRVEQILGIVGEESLIGEYSKNATRDLATADKWRYGATVAIGLAVLAAAWLAQAATKSTINWHEVVGKIVLTAALGGLAGYAAQQSSEHREAQRNAEQMALQLAALKPFLQDLTDVAERNKLLSQIALRLFGQQKSDGSKPNSTKLKLDNPTLVGQLLTLVQELVRANGTKP
jgi:cell shape-determining protein MreC